MTIPFTYSTRLYSTPAPLDGAGGTSDLWDSELPTTVMGANGFCLLLNGLNLNRRMADLADSTGDDDEAVYPLQMHAFLNEVYPLLSGLGTGEVYGTDMRWRIRYRNSNTGEVSPLSRLPDEGVNVGAEALDGSNEYVGQKAYFRLSITDAPLACTHIQLFRNTSGQIENFYLVDEVAVASVVEFTDNIPDSEIVFNELAGLIPTPLWSQGVMPPVAKAYAHPTGRIWYYGIRRMGNKFSNGGVNLTGSIGDYTLTLASHATDPRHIEFGRVGQRVAAGGYYYRITRVVSATEVQVYPALEAAVSSTTWRIDDDRDARAIYMSEPGLPWCIDPLKTIYVGLDFDDPVLNVFSLYGQTYVHTARRIYGIFNDFSEDPSLTCQIRAVSEEGTTGFQSGCWTPFGWVYLHNKLGVRVFNGQTSLPLGGESPFDDFSARTQIDRIEPSMMNCSIVAWDDNTREVYVSYAPTGMMHLRETLVFSVDDGVWRGPNHQSLSAVGIMHSGSTDDVTVFGDDFGHLYENGKQSLDLVPPVTGMTLTGSIASVSGLQMTVTSATFDPLSDQTLRGCPIWLVDANGVHYKGRIQTVISATTLQLEGYPVALDGTAGTPAANWTFSIGAIRWQAETAYIDVGEPIQPKNAERLRLRWERPDSSDVNSFSVGIDSNDVGSFGSEDGTTTEKTVDPDSKIYEDVRLRVTGVAHKLRIRGLSRNGHPKITGAVLDIDVRSGANSST